MATGNGPGGPPADRWPPIPRGEVDGQEVLFSRLQGEREVVERTRGQILQDGVKRLDKSKSPHLSLGVYDVFGPRLKAVTSRAVGYRQ